MGLLIAYLLGVLTAMQQKQEKRNRGNPEASKSNSYSLPDRPITVMSIPPSPTDQERAEQKKKKTHEAIRFWVEISGLVVLTVYAGFTIATWWQVKKSTAAAAKAANTAQQQLEVTERPWVAVVVEPIGSITWNDGGLQYSFKITCKNIGKTPAFQVTHIEGTTLKRLEDVGAAQRDLAKSYSINEQLNGRDNIMPGDDRQTIIRYQVSRKEVEDAIAYSNQRWPKTPALINPALIGVVYYRSSLDNERHQTGFIYEIGFWDPTKGITVTALDPRSDGNIPPDRVRIRHHPYADGDIN